MRSLLPALARLALLASFALLLAAPALAQQSAAPPGSPAATAAISGTQLPAPDPKFGGVIKEDALQSKPWWPPRIVPPKGAPNVLLIITDDAGFGVPSTFGGVIPTPTMERIAQQGLRYNRVFSTALCSPTRAALITGRNHHVAGFGVVGEAATGFPGYDSVIRKDTGTIGTILRENGYATSWFGKDHNTPAFQASQVGPFDQWPTGMGFEYFYGFVGGDANQWQPKSDTLVVDRACVRRTVRGAGGAAGRRPAGLAGRNDDDQRQAAARARPAVRRRDQGRRAAIQGVVGAAHRAPQAGAERAADHHRRRRLRRAEHLRRSDPDADDGPDRE